MGNCASLGNKSHRNNIEQYLSKNCDNSNIRIGNKHRAIEKQFEKLKYRVPPFYNTPSSNYPNNYPLNQSILFHSNVPGLHSFGAQDLDSNQIDNQGFLPSSQQPQKDSVKPKEFVALFDYKARTDEEICLRKGDSVFILNDNDSDWWFVQHKKNPFKGFIPSTFVAALNSLEAEEWFIPKLSRKESERLLLMKGNGRGTFLIRASETSYGGLTLSLRDREPQQVSKSLSGAKTVVRYNEIIKHYHVYRKSESQTQDNDLIMYYISQKRTFYTLHALVDFYSKSAAGLACKLEKACSRPTPITTDLSVLTKDHWEISQKSICLLDKLGAGQFGEVYKGMWNNTTEVAVKTLKPGTMSRDEFLKEARIMKALRHPKLVRLYAVCMEEPIYIIFELMSGGSLLVHLRSPLGKALDMPKLVDMMAQIASGMAYLETEHFIHRDLAARNILVGDNNVVKIADFGLARVVSEFYNDTYQAAKGTKFPIKWTAPEAAIHGQFSTKSDVWSYGIVLYEIVTFGKQPYPLMSNQETLQRVSEGYRMARPSNCPEVLHEKMLECWNKIPDQRPSFCKLFDYFEDFSITEEPMEPVNRIKLNIRNAPLALI